MTLTLPAGQADLAERDGVRSVVLLVLETFSDYAAKTASSTFYWSKGSSLRYPWGGTERHFDNPVSSVSALGSDISIVPGQQESSRQALEIELEDPAGDIWALLEGEVVIGARLTCAELLVERDHDPVDLSGYAGTEHLVRFRGDVEGLDRRGMQRLRIRASNEPPRIPWVEILDPTTNHPNDLGARLPVVVGSAKRVRGQRMVWPWVTTLAERLPTGATGNYTVTDTTGFPPSGSFDIRVTGEQMTVSLVSAGILGITARGVGASRDAEHAQGETVTEIIAEAVIGVAGHAVSNIGDLHFLNRGTGELFKVPQSVERRLSDARPEGLIATILIPGDSFEEILEDANRSSVVTVQPNFVASGGGGGGTTTTTDAEPSASPTSSMVTGAGDWNTAVTQITLTTGLNREPRANFVLGSGDLPASGDVDSWRLFINADVTNYAYPSGSSAIGLRAASNIPSGPSGVTATRTTVGVTGRKYGSPTSPPAGTSVTSLIGKYLYAYYHGNTASTYIGSTVEWVEIGIEITYTTAGGGGTVTISRSVDAVVEGAGTAFDLVPYVDVDGAVVPDTFSSGYGFGDGSGWSVSDATHVDNTTSQQVTATDSQLDAMDATTGWSGVNGTMVLDAVDFAEGTGSLKLTASAADGLIRKTTFSAIDLSANFLAFRVKPEGPTGHSTFVVVLGSLASLATDWKGYAPPQTLVNGAWNDVVIDVTTMTPLYSSGSYNSAATVAVQFSTSDAGLGGHQAGNLFRADDVRTIPIAPAIAQVNTTTGTVDLTASSDLYQLTLTGTNVHAIDVVRVTISDTAGTGTTLPAEYRQLSISGASLIEGVAVTVDASLLDTPAPTVIDVETVRIEIEKNGTSMDLPVVDVDTILVADGTNPDWADAPGTLIENPADVRKWFLAELLDLGHAAIGSTFATARTNLAGIKLAGDLSGLGISFDEIIRNLDFNSRASGYVTETASGQVHEMVTADTAYAFPAASRDLTVEESDARIETESYPEAAQLGTRFRGLYSFDASADFLGSELAFSGAVVASPVQNDTPIDIADLVAAETAIGRRDPDPYFFALLQDLASSADVLGYYAALGIGHLRILADAIVPFFEAYALEPGDMRNLPVRGSSSRKAIVTSISREPGAPEARVSLAEVE